MSKPQQEQLMMYNCKCPCCGQNFIQELPSDFPDGGSVMLFCPHCHEYEQYMVSNPHTEGGENHCLKQFRRQHL